MNRKKDLSFAFALLALALIPNMSRIARGQSKDWPVDAQKGAIVTLKLSQSLLGVPKVSRWNLNLSSKVSINPGVGEGVLVNSRSDWQESGWLLMVGFSLSKVSAGKASTEVQLKKETLKTFANGFRRNETWTISLKFMMAPELVNKAFHKVAFVGEPSAFERDSYYQNELADRLLPKIFVGKLSDLTREQQLRIVRAADYEADAVRLDEYKGHWFIRFTVEGESVYNTLQLGQTARVARVAQDYLLSALKAKSALLAGIPGIDGIRLDMKIAYKDFVERFAAEQYDELAIYSVLDDVKRFAEAEITNQELLDRSVVIVNGNRVKVSLEQAK